MYNPEYNKKKKTRRNWLFRFNWNEYWTIFFFQLNRIKEILISRKLKEKKKVYLDNKLYIENIEEKKTEIEN